MSRKVLQLWIATTKNCFPEFFKGATIFDEDN